MRVTGLHVYPIKSCAGVAVRSWPLDTAGLRYDRSYMLVTPEGRCLTQREEPRMALIRPVTVGDDWDVHLPDGVVLRLPRRPGEGPLRTVSVWEHTGPAVDVGDLAATALSRHLGRPVRLVGVTAQHHRTADPRYAPADVPVGFADGFPVLITALASLDELNARLDRPLPMARFRPNVVIDGRSPYEEDLWGRVRAGAVALDLVKACARCSITTVDPDTGRRDGSEPLRTLGDYRRGSRGVLFGQNAVVAVPGPLAVGDEVTVSP